MNSKKVKWSVMIPSYNCSEYLKQTLESVLVQDLGPDSMQIEVVDDCSTKDDPKSVVTKIGKGRVSFYKKTKKEGATKNFNTCIERSKGEFVHILHGDDIVHDGFYKKVTEVADANPDCSIFIVRTFTISENGEIDSLSKRLEWMEEGSNSPNDLFYGNEIRTPGVVIRKAFYEKHGGFIEHLVHVADWEMWCRAITVGKGCFINTPLASYRSFIGNDTSRLSQSAENLRDYMRLKEIFSKADSGFVSERFMNLVSGLAADQKKHFDAHGMLDASRCTSDFINSIKVKRTLIDKISVRIKSVLKLI